MPYTLQAGQIRFKNQNTSNPKYQNAINILTNQEAAQVTDDYLGQLEDKKQQAVTAVESVGSRYTTAYTNCVQATNNANSALSYIAPVFSTSAVYKAGDLVIYNGDIYCRKTDATVSESWISSNWVKTSISNEVQQLTDNLALAQTNQPTSNYNRIWFPMTENEVSIATEADVNAVADMVAQVYDNTKTYSVGDYCRYNNQLYRCITEISTSEEWTAEHWTAVMVGSEVNDLKSTFNYFVNTGRLKVFEGTYTGTRRVAVPVNIPAGTYMLTVDNISSVDTDAETSSIYFYYKTEDGGGDAHISLERDRSIAVSVRFEKEVGSVYLFASNSANNSAGDTFTYTNVVLSKMDEGPSLEENIDTIRKNIIGNSLVFDKKVDLPCVSGTVSYGDYATITKDTDIYRINGQIISANVRVPLTCTELTWTSANPTKSSVPHWYLGNIPSFIIGHSYRFHIKVIGGTFTPNASDRTVYIALKTDSDEQLGSFTDGNVWACTAQPSTVFFVLRDGTYEDAIFFIAIEDLTLKQMDINELIVQDYEDITAPLFPGQLCSYGGKLYSRISYSAEKEDSFAASRWEEVGLSEISENRVKYTDNNFSAFAGGVSRIPFEQGGANQSTGFLLPTANAKRARNKLSMMPLVSDGDVITIEDGFKAYLSYVHLTKDGIVVDEAVGWRVGKYRVTHTSLLGFLVDKVDGTEITPEEAEEAIAIVHNGTNGFALKGNPYQNIPWDAVQDVTSVCHTHLHGDDRQTLFNNLKSKYDHIAISMYYPSAPIYPLESNFENVGNTLGSPNAEHVRMTGENVSLHLCAVGSYLATTPDSTAPYIHVGTLDEVVQEAVNSMKGNGGAITINHPRWSKLTADKILSILRKSNRVTALQVWNASSEMSNGTGDSSELWDEVLSTGTQVFATAVPDHELEYHPNENRCGFGYNHMLVINRTEDEVLNAYRNGRYYCTLYNDGLTLRRMELDTNKMLSITVSKNSTYLFKTATRSVDVSTPATSATFQTQDNDIYVRVEVYSGSNRLWTNAIMLI